MEARAYDGPVCAHSSGPDCLTCSNLCSTVIPGGAAYPNMNSLSDESGDDCKRGDQPGGVNGKLEDWSDSDEEEIITEAAEQFASWSFMMAGAGKPIPKQYPRPVGQPKKGHTWDLNSGKWIPNDSFESDDSDSILARDLSVELSGPSWS